MIEEGATVRERQIILWIVDLSVPMQVNTKVRESMVDRVTPGQKANITIDAFANSAMPGKVVEVFPLPDPVAMASWDRKVYTTKVQLDGSQNQKGLRLGMTASVEILINELNNVLAVPIQSVLQLHGKHQVAVRKADGTFERRPVALGDANDRLVEVKQGLRAGEFVALNPADLLSEQERREYQPPPGQPRSNQK
jgi:multidrug efflux pump subunit AcrA (membrane-fusion protein)